MMSNVGRAACSILTLGWFCRLFSCPPGEGCPGNFPNDDTDLPCSSSSPESVALLLRGDGALRVFRTGRFCSLRGGTGGCSGSGASASLLPRGPRGSSTASSLVVRAPARCGVRGPRGDRGVISALIGFGVDFGGASIHI